MAVAVPGSYRLYEDAGSVKATHPGRGGSHFLIIEDEHLRLADEKGYAAFPGGILTIPHSGGKVVKWVYIKKLIDAIELKERFLEFLRKAN